VVAAATLIFTPNRQSPAFGLSLLAENDRGPDWSQDLRNPRSTLLVPSVHATGGRDLTQEWPFRWTHFKSHGVDPALSRIFSSVVVVFVYFD